MARDGGPTPALGWCDPVLRKHPIERFVSRTRIFDTKRSNDDFRVTFQTTPVPPRDRCRCAALPLLISGGEPEKCPISTRPTLALELGDLAATTVALDGTGRQTGLELQWCSHPVAPA